VRTPDVTALYPGAIRQIDGLTLHKLERLDDAVASYAFFGRAEI
jgi:hypothetical protein